MAGACDLSHYANINDFETVEVDLRLRFHVALLFYNP